MKKEIDLIKDSKNISNEKFNLLIKCFNYIKNYFKDYIVNIGTQYESDNCLIYNIRVNNKENIFINDIFFIFSDIGNLIDIKIKDKSVSKKELFKYINDKKCNYNHKYIPIVG